MYREWYGKYNGYLFQGIKGLSFKLGTCQKLAGGEGGWKQRGGHNFLSLRKGRGHEKWAVKRGRVMQIYARDHVEVHPQKKKEVLYLEEVDDHDECEVDEGDEALPTCSSDEDFVLGEIGESSDQSDS